MSEPTKITEEKIVTRPLDPIIVPVIGGTGNGTPLRNGQLLETPNHQPNVRVQVVSTTTAVAVRFANAYLASILTALTIELSSHGMAAGEFAGLFVRSASYALAGP